MVTRSILLFPQFENDSVIHAMRRQYDPLAELIPPHLTLVFPFASSLTASEIAAHVERAVQDIQPFRLVLRGIRGADEEYLFLHVQEGQERIIDLHDRLYTGILAGYLRRDLPYLPHLTVGRIQDLETWRRALQETSQVQDVFSTTMEEIHVEVIGADEESIIEHTVILQGEER